VQSADSSSSSSAGGTITVNEAVNVRSGASTDSSKLGSAHSGDKFTLTGQEGDGYKIDYNGQTAYIKAEFCTKN
ncbi:MAG: SH3 domain-containing protein, partial [Eubacteriaceae bacterium]|nr:SH3 domain-containing protein [Eubacteriaceae bacterium]